MFVIMLSSGDVIEVNMQVGISNMNIQVGICNIPTILCCAYTVMMSTRNTGDRIYVMQIIHIHE